MTIYFSGTTPLWEKIAQVSPKLFGNDGRKNIKGQKYYFDNDSLSQSNSNVSSNEGKVINYAEVFGKGKLFHKNIFLRCLCFQFISSSPIKYLISVYAEYNFEFETSTSTTGVWDMCSKVFGS